MRSIFKETLLFQKSVDLRSKCRIRIRSFDCTIFSCLCIEDESSWGSSESDFISFCSLSGESSKSLLGIHTTLPLSSIDPKSLRKFWKLHSIEDSSFIRRLIHDCFIEVLICLLSSYIPCTESPESFCLCTFMVHSSIIFECCRYRISVLREKCGEEFRLMILLHTVWTLHV